MAVSFCKFKIILCNFLHGAPFDVISREVIYCPTIVNARKSIEEYRALSYRIIVSCRKQDADELADQVSNGNIDQIYILDNNVTKVTVNGRKITVSDEKALVNSIRMRAAELALDAYYVAEKQQENGIANENHDIFERLLKSICSSGDQEHEPIFFTQ